jgi:hypothetical protein
MVLLEVSLDAMFTVATNASYVKIANVFMQDQAGRLQSVSFWARKLNNSESGNSYPTYDSKAMAVSEAVKHGRCYLEGSPKFQVVSDNDTLRHMMRQP